MVCVIAISLLKSSKFTICRQFSHLNFCLMFTTHTLSKLGLTLLLMYTRSSKSSSSSVNNSVVVSPASHRDNGERFLSELPYPQDVSVVDRTGGGRMENRLKIVAEDTILVFFKSGTFGRLFFSYLICFCLWNLRFCCRWPSLSLGGGTGWDSPRGQKWSASPEIRSRIFERHVP